VHSLYAKDWINSIRKMEQTFETLSVGNVEVAVMCEVFNQTYLLLV
jgi:hypothetical protein